MDTHKFKRFFGPIMEAGSGLCVRCKSQLERSSFEPALPRELALAAVHSSFERYKVYFAFVFLSNVCLLFPSRDA